MQATLDPAQEADAGELLSLMRGLYDPDGTPFRESEARDAVLGLIRDSSLGRIWLIRSGNETLGYAVLTLGYSLEFLGRDAFVDELFVLPEHRGRGLGKRAMALLEEQCRALGVRALHLEVSRGNEAARGLYRRFGFEDRSYVLMTRRIEP